MKQETKMLFGYLRSAVKVATASVNSGLEHFQVSEEKVINQINELESKLEEMEVALKMGGVIQDENGNLCKHGDRCFLTVGLIRFKNHKTGDKILGTLIWEKEFLDFRFIPDEDKNTRIRCLKYIEKCTPSSVTKEEILNASKDIKSNSLKI